MPRRSISSLDSSPDSSDDGYDSDEELRLAQQEWEENVRQLQLLVSVVLLPYVGKFLGRKWAHSGEHCMLDLNLRSAHSWQSTLVTPVWDGVPPFS